MKLNISFEGNLGFQQFYQILENKRVFSYDSEKKVFKIEKYTEARIDLSNSSFFLPVSVALISLLIRTLAENNLLVQIVTPHGNKSTNTYLAKLGFYNLFENIPANPWSKKILFVGSRKKYDSKYELAETNYIPLSWYDQNDFEFDRSKNILKVTQRVKADLDKSISEILTTQGFMNVDIIETFTRVFFKEIAWNTILHSSSSDGQGFGIYGGQIFNLSQNKKRLDFFFCDLGKSIPVTLAQKYNDVNKTYHTDDEVSKNTGILRFSLDPYGSSRTVFPSKREKESYRGLTQVASAINGYGTIELISNGGHITVLGESRDRRNHVQVKDLFGTPSQCELPGTFIKGSINHNEEVVLEPTNIPSEIIPIPEYCLLRSYDYSGNIWFSKSNIIKKVEVKRNAFILLDIGYSDISVRDFEFLVKDYTLLLKNKYLAFINFNTHWNLFEHILEWLQSQSDVITYPIIFIRNYDDSAVLFNKALNEQKIRELYKTFLPFFNLNDVKELLSNTLFDYLYKIKINNNAITNIISEANSKYLMDGFIHGTTNEGFFTGSIQLPSGRNVSNYFSLIANLKSKYGTTFKRWNNSLNRCITELTQQSHDDILILGTSSFLLNLLIQSEFKSVNNYAAYTLSTFDLPTKEEITAISKKYQSIIVIADVISTGSFISEIVELVKNTNKKILGIIAIVDAKGTNISFKFETNLRDIKVLTCSKAEIQDINQSNNSSKKYWVDPISQLPIDKNIYATEIDPKIESTIDIISKYKVAKIHHIIDGTRHSTIFIDLHKLITNLSDQEIHSFIKSSADITIKNAKWQNNFKPKYIIYAAGVSRIQKIFTKSGSVKDYEYQNSTDVYVKCLQKYWPKSKTIEVARAFEPGGNSKCAQILSPIEQTDFKNSITNKSFDIILADDGIWSGKTIKSLLNLILTLNVRKILVLPLLARFSMMDLKYYNSINSLNKFLNSNYISKSKVSIAFGFPFILPIPFYSNVDCPVDMTIERLERWKNSRDPISRIVQNIIENLKGYSPLDEFELDPDYIKSWLKLRVHLELAVESEDALHIVEEYINNSSEMNDIGVIINIFLQEWSLLGRSRIRHALSDMLIRKFLIIIKDENVNTTHRINALSFIRSQFTYVFVNEIISFTKYINNIDFLERLVLHIYSLKNELIKENPKFKEGLVELNNMIIRIIIDLKFADNKLITRYTECAAIITSLLYQFSEVLNISQIEMVKQLYKMIMYDGTLRHDVWQIFSIWQNNTEEITASTFKIFYGKWKNRWEAILMDKVVVLIDNLKELLIITSTPDQELPPLGTNYITGLSENPNANNLKDDLMSIKNSIEYLSEKPENSIFKKSLSISCARVIKHIGGENSYLIGLFHQLHSSTVHSLIKGFESEIISRISPKLNYKLDYHPIINLDEKIINYFIFCPSHVIEELKTKIVSNIEKYAFPKGAESNNNKLQLIVEKDESNKVRFTLMNNGENLPESLHRSDSTIRTSKDLQVFGGDLTPPEEIHSSDWKVKQTVFFQIWGGLHA